MKTQPTYRWLGDSIGSSGGNVVVVLVCAVGRVAFMKVRDALGILDQFDEEGIARIRAAVQLRGVTA